MCVGRYTPIEMVELGDFNKITEKLPFLAFLPILDNFQIFAKVHYILLKFNEKYASEVAMPPYGQPYLS